MQTVARWFWYLMPANPIVVRIVQGSSRRMRDLWVRMAYLGALIILVLVGLMSVEGIGSTATLTDLAKAGTKVFAIVAYGQVILVCLLAPLFMAGAINQERQGETFDILLTTPLTNLQIVLGTLLSRLYFILALLMSGLPLFAVLLIFGGVPVASIFVAFAVAALTAVFVGSIAVTLSVLRTGGRKAVYIFVIVIAAYLVASYTADRMIRLAARSTAGATAVGRTTWVTPLHPLLVLEASFNNLNYRPYSAEDVADRAWPVAMFMSNPLGAYATIILSSSALMLLFSATQVRRLGQGMPMIPLPSKWRTFLRLDAPGERTRPPRNVWNSPIAWREANARGNKFAGIIARGGFILLGLIAAIVLVVKYHNGTLPDVANTLGAKAQDQGPAFRMGLLSLLLLELAVIVIVALYMSAGCVSKEREDGTLDLLLTTPVTPQQYVWGKLRGLVSFLSALIAVPVLTMAIACIYTLFAGDRGQVAYYVGTNRYNGPLLYPEMMLILPLVLVPFVALCVTVGMTWSIKAKGVLGAVIPSVAIIGSVVLVLGFCGWNAVQNVPAIGPVINAFSPVTNLIVLVNPIENVSNFLRSGDNSASAGRVSIFIGALVAAAGYSVIVYVYLAATVKSFDQTVRKLSGTAS